MTRIPSGSTDRYIYFVAVDPTDLKTREEGLSSFTVYYSRNGGASAQDSTPTVNETDGSSNMPGVYEYLVTEDTTLTAGNDTEEYCVHITHGSMAPVTRVIEIYRPETTEGNTLGVAATGDISGNVDGEVASVAGAVGSVTGAVGSVTAGVTVSGTITTLDALDTALDSAHGAGSWATAVGFSTHAAADVWSVATRELSGTIGDFDALDTALDAAHGAGSWATAVGFSTHAAADVWAVDASTQQTQGTFGQAIGDPGVDVDTIWGLCNTNLDATVASRSSHAAADIWSVGTRELSGTIGDFDALDTALDSAHGAGSWATAVGFSTHSANNVRDAILSDSTPFNGANINAAITTRSTFDPTADPVELLDSGGTAGTSAAELVVDIFANTLSELTVTPGTTPTFAEASMLQYHALRNQLDMDTTATDYLKIYNNAGTCIAKKAVTDDGSTYSEAKMQDGP